ncbi:MAG: class I SAM-dependent methyltransferase [Gaiellaceae bacterium]
MTPTAYAFRDSPLAERRLGLVAEIFDPASALFLRDQAPREPGLAVDLGCGPGFSTRLLRGAVRPREIVGVDGSESFLAAARRRLPEARFLLRNLREPLALGAPADVAYCRLVLGHLENPLAVLDGWRASLAPGGRLLVDEVEAIESDDPAFARYLDLVRELLASRGHRMEIGPLLAGRMPEAAVHSQIVRVAAEPARVGRMFRANLAVFGDDPLVAGRAKAIDEALAEAKGPIEWQLRQLVVEGGGGPR